MKKNTNRHGPPRNPLKIVAIFAIVFLICCLIFGGVIAVMIKLGQEPEDVPDAAVVPAANPLNILIVGQDEGITGCLLVRLNYADGSVPVVSLPPELSLTARGRTDTLKGHMVYGGINQVVAGVEETLAINVDRYVMIGRSVLVNFIDRLGGIHYTLDRAVSYGNSPGEQTNTLQPGDHNLTGIMVAGLLMSSDAGRGAKDHMLTEVCVALLNQYLTSGILDRAEGLFENVIGQVQTNIGFADLTISLLNSSALLEKDAPAYALQNNMDFSGNEVRLSQEKISEIGQRFN